jgi:RsiW-degrading membrane proteinase PrsW (M82 family)
MTLTILVALLIAIAIPIGVMIFIYKLDFYKTGQFIIMLVCFGAGGLAYGLAAFINPLSLRGGLANYNQMIQFVAPVVEEILKGIAIWILVRRPKFNYFVDGAIYGFTAGIGFAVLENIEYVMGHPSAALAVAINRVISTNLMHAAATATLGIIIGIARFRKTTPRILLSLGGLVTAMILHMGFNNLVTRVNSGWLLLYAIIIGAGASALIVVMIRRGLEEERTWIGETLNQEMRVEREEAAAVQNLDNVDHVIQHLAERLGEDKAEQIRKLLYIQARLGIKTKGAEMMEDANLRTAILTELASLRKEMEAARKQIGSYAMMYLRATHLEESFSWQDLLAHRIEEASQQTHPAGPSIFDRLGDRLASPDTNPTHHSGG